MAQGAVASRHRRRLSAEGTVTAGGSFEVLAITAGEGNGWQFGEDCLHEALSLFDGPECFVDHGLYGHSVRDLAGVLHAPAWDAQRKGIKCQLRPLGPSGALLAQIGQELLADEKGPRVGFSADVVFTSQGKQVQKILRVLSVDLVFNPARGGAFLRALNSRKESERGTVVPSGTTVPSFSVSSEPMKRGDADMAENGSDMDKAAEQARIIRAEMCGYLLESGLAGARLPQPVVERIRKQFGGKVFEAAELTQAIEDQRVMLAELTAAQSITGPGRISGMFSSEDRLQAAVDDLFGASREKGQESVRVARLSGIRELYLMTTGDDDMHGGYHPERARLATTADFTGLVKNAMNKIVADKWAELGRAGYNWWEKVVSVEHCGSLNDITGILVGTVGTLPTVAEGGAYTELAVGDSPEVGSFTKYGGLYPADAGAD